MTRLSFILLVIVLSFRSGHADLVGIRPESVTGLKLDLTEYKGKVVLLHFWATWCKTCAFEMKDIQTIENEFSDKGFVVVGISASNEKDTLKFLKENKITFQNRIDRFGKALNDYEVTALPTHVLIDRNGKMLRKWIGRQDWLGPEIKKALLEYLH